MFDRFTLRAILLVDGLVSGAMGVLLIAGAGLLDTALDLPTAFLRGVGFVLLPWCALLAVIATRQPINRLAVRLVIAVNLGWVAASLVLPFTRWVEPNALGIAFVLAQSVAVLGFAVIQSARLVEAAPPPATEGRHGFQV